MAIVENFWLKGQKKKLAGSVIYQAMGQTRQRALATEISNPRTQAQMNQRVKWANLVNLYRANQSWMKYAFETKKATQSDYNKFMSLNVTDSNIFLTKQIAAAGGCVVQNYLITQGSLPSIENVYDTDNNFWITNIYLPDDFSLSGSPVSMFSKALIDSNPAIREGDQLSFIRMTQMTNPDNGAPYVVVRKYEMVVSLTNTRPVSDFLPAEYITVSGADPGNSLCVNNSGTAGGFVLILSRTIGGKTYVSSQRIVVANNSAIINAYSSQSALAAAIASYGDSNEPFLTSTSANLLENIFVPYSIVSVRYSGGTVVPGSQMVILRSYAESTVQVNLNNTFYGPIASIVLNVVDDNGDVQVISLDHLSEVQGVIAGNLPVSGSLPTKSMVDSIVVTTENGDIFEAHFVVPNEWTIHGME